MPLIPFDEIVDKRFPPGSPERAEHDVEVARSRQRYARVRLLTGWMFNIPPRWTYATDVIDGEVVKFKHGVGHIAQCFWGDLLESALEGKPADRSLSGWFGDTFYNACDALSFHYLDDAYVPTFADLRAGRAGRRQTAWRDRHAALLAQARESLAELRAEGLLNEDEGARQ